MFGFVLGILSVAALVGAFRLGRRIAWYGGGRRWGQGYRRGGWVLDRLLRRLEARPEQEAEIRQALQQLFDDLRRHRQTFEALRSDLAAAVTADASSTDAFDAAFTKVDGAATSAREALRQAFARLHKVLDATQRQRLAELVLGRAGFCGRAAAHPVQL